MLVFHGSGAKRRHAAGGSGAGRKKSVFNDPAHLMDLTFLDGLGISSGCVELPVMTWRCDLQGSRDWLSEAWGVFTGLPLRDAQRGAAEWTDCMHPEDRERCAGIFRACAASGTAFTMDYRLLRMDGTCRWVMDSGLPQYADHVLMGYAGACVDVHARRLSGDRLAERMRLHRLHERRRDAQLMALAGELREALAADGPSDTSTPSERLARAQGHLAVAAGRIESLIGGAAVESGARLMPVADVVRVAAQLVDPPMTRTGHQLVIDMPEPDMLLYADSLQLGRAVAGVVEFVGDACEQPGKIGLAVRLGDNAAYLRIALRGEAAEPDFVPRAFELARRSGALLVGSAAECWPPVVQLDFAHQVVQLHGGELLTIRREDERPPEWIARIPLAH